jgi:GT2 family glycosyltransferase
VDASVIVVNWHQPDLTARCIRSLADQDVEGTVEIVLVENEAAPGAAERWAREFPDLVVVERADNAGFAGGVDAGVRVSRGDVLVLLNNDAVAEPGFLESGLSRLRGEGEDVAVVTAAVELEGTFEPAPGPGADVLTGLDGSWWRRSTSSRAVRLVNGTGVDVDRSGNGHDRDWLRPVEDERGGGRSASEEPFGFSGGAAFIRRDALAEVGGFDASLFMYYEDLDVSWRLRLGGLRIVHDPRARAVHRHAASSGSGSSLVRYQSMRNRLAVVARNGSASLLARVVVRTLVRFLRDLARPAAAQLSGRDWARLARETPVLVRSARRARRGDGASGRDRRRVEALFGGHRR